MNEIYIHFPPHAILILETSCEYISSEQLIFIIAIFSIGFNKTKIRGLRNFTFGFNWIEFTHDALIKYQAMTCGFTLLHVPFFRKAYLPNRADPGLVLLGDLLGCALTPVKDTATCGAKHP